MSVTRTQIRLEVARLLAGAHMISGTTTSAGAAGGTSIIDSTYASTLLQDGHFVGAIIYLTSGTYTGTWRRVAGFTAASGTFTVDSAFGGQVASGVTYELHTTINPILIHEAVDRALRKMLYLSLAVPSLMADADMETSGVTSWTASGSSLAKDTTAGNFWRGVQALSVTDSGSANGYARQRFNVTPGDTYYVWAACRNSAVATSCKLQAYDVTNSVEIDSETSTQLAWGGLGFSFTIPTSCEQMDIRLITVTASGVSYWDHVGLFQSGGRRYALPTWVTEPWQVGRLVYQPEGTEFVSDTTTLDVTAPVRWAHLRVKKEGATVYVVPDPAFNGNRPVYLECLRAYSALSADTSTTDADMDWVATKARYECLRMLAAPMVPSDEREEFKKALDEAKSEAAAQDARFMPKVDYPFTFGEEELFSLQEIG